MKLGKLLLGAISAAALLSALVSSASARNLELSSQSSRVIWTRWSFRETSFFVINTECEIVMRGSFHTRTMTKTVNSLIGYITEASILRCARGGLTINRESLPWHRRYKSFNGALPNITGLAETISGAEWRISEAGLPEVTCTILRQNSSAIFTYALSGGVITGAEARGSSPCGRFTAEVAGSSTSVVDGAGARITVRLI